MVLPMVVPELVCHFAFVGHLGCHGVLLKFVRFVLLFLNYLINFYFMNWIKNIHSGMFVCVSRRVGVHMHMVVWYKKY